MRARTYRRSILLWGILMLGACRWGAAQVPGNSLTIRVEANRVLVPVYFLGDRLSDLPAKSLRLFVDGKRQKIQSVDTVSPTANHGVRGDNLGAHFEWAPFPQGIWSTADLEPRWFAHFYGGAYYVIAFSPPPSPEGSCHRLQITARRYQSLLEYRREYCNVPHSSTDPLRGSSEGARLERDISSGKEGRIPLSAEASYVYTAPGEARVQIDMEFPFSDALPLDDVLIIAYKKNGEAMARRSGHFFVSGGNIRGWYEGNVAFAFLWAPTRYDAQMELPPGDYRIAVAFRRGSKFGVTEVPLTIKGYDPKQLSISSVALCKRVRKVGYPPIAAGFVPLVSKGYEFTPAADTVFQKGNSLMAYFEVYEPAFGETRRSAVSVSFAMRIINEKTGAVILKKVLSAASYRVPGKAAIPIAVEPVLRQLHLTPGKYEFEIQAFDSVGHKTPWEESKFSYK